MKYLLSFILLLFSLAASASELRTYDLQHRSAEELIPLLRPMVEAGGAISGSGFTLIVRSSRENLEQIESLVRRLDHAPRMLLISVEQGGGQSAAGRGASIHGSSAENRGSIRLRSTRRAEEEQLAQRLQVLEGHWATIRSGQAVPQVSRNYQQTPGGARIEQHIEYRNVDSGFDVRPRLNGDRVTLDIRPFRAAPSPHGGGVIEQQTISTTVSGRIGEWIELGGLDEQRAGDASGILYSTRQRGELTRNVRIRVDLPAN